MDPLSSIEIKAFVPARDFALSQRFYQAIGFEMEWDTAELACFRNGTSRFLLQNFHEPKHTDNFLMSLLVDDLEAWWSHVSKVAGSFGLTVEPPEDRPWGMRDFALLDPSGVVWRIGSPLP
jgi:catechol 2,3-dioxygenase-like lactoylglutathione lyase family enzyme